MPVDIFDIAFNLFFFFFFLLSFLFSGAGFGFLGF